LPLDSFEVQSYEVSAHRVGFAGVPRTGVRSLVLTGPDLAHGITPIITLDFDDTGPSTGTLGTANDIGTFTGPRYRAHLPVDWFDDIYRLVQTEKPVMVDVLYDNPPAGFPPSGGFDNLAILYVRVGTNDEPPGEGLVDAS
jgi:hypothetical protein